MLNLSTLTDLEQIEILVKFLQDSSLTSVKVSYFNERLTCLNLDDECFGEVIYLYKKDSLPITLETMSNQIFLNKGSAQNPLQSFSQALNHVYLPQIKETELAKLLTKLGMMLADSSQHSDSHKLVSPLEDMNSWQREMSDESQTIRTMLNPIQSKWNGLDALGIKKLKALLEETVSVLDNLWSNSYAYTQERMTTFIMSFFEAIHNKIV